MPDRRDTVLTQLFERLGYAFKNRSLIELALTHASARPSLKPNEDNERLEFLGDRVLGLAIAELLTASFPDASEGSLPAASISSCAPRPAPRSRKIGSSASSS